MSATQAKQPASSVTVEARSDIQAYIASLTDEQRARLTLAEVAIELVDALEEAQDNQDQAKPASPDLAHVLTTTHFEQGGMLAPLSALQRYLNELGFSLELHLVALESGQSVGRLTPPIGPIDRA